MTIKYNCNYEGTIPFSDTCWQIRLAANISQAITIPGDPINNYQALFGYNSTSNVFVRKNATPTSPPSGTTNTESFSAFRPQKVYVKGGDVLNIISPDASTYVGISLMQI